MSPSNFAPSTSAHSSLTLTLNSTVRLTGLTFLFCIGLFIANFPNQTQGLKCYSCNYTDYVSPEGNSNKDPNCLSPNKQILNLTTTCPRNNGAQWCIKRILHGKVIINNEPSVTYEKMDRSCSIMDPKVDLKPGLCYKKETEKDPIDTRVTIFPIPNDNDNPSGGTKKTTSTSTTTTIDPKVLALPRILYDYEITCPCINDSCNDEPGQNINKFVLYNATLKRGTGGLAATLVADIRTKLDLFLITGFIILFKNSML